MLKRDKNGFLDILLLKGYRIDQFEAYETLKDQNNAFVIHLKNSPLEFWVRNNPNSFNEYDMCYTTFSPKFAHIDYWPLKGWHSDISTLWSEFGNWLDQHVELFLQEESIPDLWATAQEESEFESSTFDDDSMQPFTESEKVALRVALQGFKEKLISTYQPSANQLAEIDKKLDYLTDALDRMNRIDWKSLLISTLIGISTTLCLDTNTGRELYAIAKQTFAMALNLIQ